MEYTLSMTFLTDAGVKSTLTISDVKPDITEAQVNTLMDVILAKNIFMTRSGVFAHKDSAQLTAKTVTKYNL